MDLKSVKEELLRNREEKYQAFSGALMGESTVPLLGVRLPVLRKMAAALAKADARAFLDSCDFSSVEMILLYGFVLGRLRGEIEEALFYLDRVLPHIDCWLTCDTVCQSFKQARKHPEAVWEKLMVYRQSERPFTLRVMAVLMLSHFLTDDYIDRVLETLGSVRCEDYYYRMGAAWAVATAMAKYREQTLAFLRGCRLDDWTYNKAIQKMIESYRVSEADKALLRTMKSEYKNIFYIHLP